MAFTGKSLGFLEENHQRNDRAWFKAHKSDYIDYVQPPMRELAEDLLPMVVQIDPRLERAPKRTLSRIYRDTRFSRDKSLFKRGSWLVFQLGKGMAGPI
ncbi:MAG: DUF2461 domain-containing protein [Oxalobacter sp.]|nr:DUF2461 domain-containing protein [Oxalobacter sp.]